MAAFFVDITVIFFVISFASQLIGMLAQLFSISNLHQVFFINIFVVYFASVGYYATQEWRWGFLGCGRFGARVVAHMRKRYGAPIQPTLGPMSREFSG